MKRYTIALLSLVIAGSVLSGCRKKNTEPTTMPPVSTEATTQATTAATTAPTTLPTESQNTTPSDSSMPSDGTEEPTASSEGKERGRIIPRMN